MGGASPRNVPRSEVNGNSAGRRKDRWEHWRHLGALEATLAREAAGLGGVLSEENPASKGWPVLVFNLALAAPEGAWA